MPFFFFLREAGLLSRHQYFCFAISGSKPAVSLPKGFPAFSLTGALVPSFIPSFRNRIGFSKLSLFWRRECGVQLTRYLRNRTSFILPTSRAFRPGTSFISLERASDPLEVSVISPPSFLLLFFLFVLVYIHAAPSPNPRKVSLTTYHALRLFKRAPFLLKMVLPQSSANLRLLSRISLIGPGIFSAFISVRQISALS